MQAIIDSGFILNAIHRGIDFAQELEKKGFKILLPKESMQELRNMEHDVKTSQDEKNLINKALDLLEDHRRFKRISSGGGKISDWLAKKDSEGYFIGTTDKSVKHKLQNKVEL